MERLPLLLTSTIQSACEQFRNITFTVHGENDKARISIVFTNQDNNKAKRKSSSTIRRDNKRLRDYSENIASNTVSTPSTTIPLEIESNSLVEHNEMDIENTLSSASSTGESKSVECNTNDLFTIDTCSETPDCSDVVNNDDVCKQIGSEDNTELKCMEKQCTHTDVFSSFVFNKTIESNACNIQPDINNIVTKNTNKSNDENSTSEIDQNTCSSGMSNKTTESFQKIVFKQSRYDDDLLVGKTSRARLILFNMRQKTYEILEYSDRNYWKLDKATDAFDDVRNTHLLTEEVKHVIPQMFEFLENNKHEKL